MVVQTINVNQFTEMYVCIHMYIIRNRKDDTFKVMINPISSKYNHQKLYANHYWIFK